MEACRCSSPAVVAYLLTHGSFGTIDAKKYPHSETALFYWSCLCGNLSAIQLLLAAEADPRITDVMGGDKLCRSYK